MATAGSGPIRSSVSRLAGRSPKLAETSASIGHTVLSAVDNAASARWDRAVLRASRTHGSREERVAQVRKLFAAELSAAGAAIGGAAAVPAVGTAAAVTMGVAEVGWITVRVADLILTIAAIHGHTEAEVEERRAWILSILAFGDSAFVSFTKLAGEMGKGLGAKATARVSAESLRALNRALGRTIVTKYGTKRGVIALGRVLPFGIGAVIGSTANYAAVRVLSRQADSFFRQLAPPPDPVIEGA